MIPLSIETLNFAREVCTSAVPALNDSRAPQVIAVFVIITLLSITSVFLRLISRKISNIKYGWDDYLIIIALVRNLQAVVRYTCITAVLSYS